MNSTDLSLSELFVVVLQSYLSLRPCMQELSGMSEAHCVPRANCSPPTGTKRRPAATARPRYSDTEASQSGVCAAELRQVHLYRQNLGER
jgi:hypothetical protein